MYAEPHQEGDALVIEVNVVFLLRCIITTNEITLSHVCTCFDKSNDTTEIRTLAGKAQLISNQSP